MRARWPMNSSRIAITLRQGIGLCVAFVGVLVVAGCREEKPTTYSVNGQVLVDGKAAEGATVIFCPVDPSVELKDLRPLGRTNSTGAFALMTFMIGDGAPAGHYKVLVKWPAPATVDPREDRGGPQRPDRLRGKYYTLDTTPLSATIEQHSNKLPPFNLSSK